jgi:hypothetical protein
MLDHFAPLSFETLHPLLEDPLLEVPGVHTRPNTLALRRLSGNRSRV